jgi:major membrane immunogen (membrane-anchored lipoprotein)
MEKKRGVLKTGISFMVIFSFLLTGCGMMRKIDNMKADMKLMKE